MIGVYHGKKKPKDPNLFLSDFVNDLVPLLEHGYNYHDKVGELSILRVEAILIRDAPAKAMILGIKTHTWYHSCTKCVIRGKWAGRVVFTEQNNTLRTDDGFCNQSDNEYHCHATILTRLKVNLVDDVPLDYMHLCCLGVMKKLMQYWVSGSFSVRISPNKPKRCQRF